MEIVNHEKHPILRAYMLYNIVYETELYLYLVKILNTGLHLKNTH